MDALFVILVPLEQPLDAPMLDKEEQAAASLAEAQLLGRRERRASTDHGAVASIGQAIIQRAVNATPT